MRTWKLGHEPEEAVVVGRRCKKFIFCLLVVYGCKVYEEKGDDKVIGGDEGMDG